jgi:hypothetical protein
MSNITKYILRAELHNRVGSGKLQSHLFEREFYVRFLHKTGQNATFYDPELKMHFEDKSALSYLYEIEIYNAKTICGGELEKSADFIRRINYVYDWIQLNVNMKGKITFIENKEELKKQWSKIKLTLTHDYKGIAVDEYLEKVDQRFEEEKEIWQIVYQYFNFGLLFPHIPYKHNSDWEQKRLIEFSEYEDERFEEHIVYEKTEKGLRNYRVIITTQKDSATILEQYEGKIIIAENNLLPVMAVIEIVFREDNIANQWYFKIEKN